MSATALLRSRASRWIFPLVLLLFCCRGPVLLGQTQIAPPAQPQSPGSAVSHDPTQQQAQPSLTVDRDPVRSPDTEEKAPVEAAVPASTPSSTKALQKQGDGFTLRRDVDEVLLNCTVVDDKGRLVTDLDHTDFRIWEDDVPQTIASYQHRDVPVALGILVDNSGSMRDKRGAVNDAALHLVKASNAADSAFIVNFSDQAYIDQDFTSNIGELEKGLSRIDSKGGTALYDAVVASANEMARHAKQQKQALLIITDGGDNASRLNLEQAIRRVQALEGPVVYSIGLLYEDLSKDEAARARKDLESLSLATGGVAYFPHSLDEVDEIAAQVAHDIRNQYTLGYHSTKPASLGGFRTVHVEAKAPKHGKMIVRTRKGYLPKMPQQPQTAQATP